MSSAPCLFKSDEGRRCYAIVVAGTGYCPAHQKPKWSGWRPAMSKTFLKNRPFVMRRANYQCENIPEGYQRCTRTATDVDHIKSRAKGGTDDLYNLRALCKDCHTLKTQQDARDGYDDLNKPAPRRPRQ